MDYQKVAIDLIKECEGVSLKAYPDPGTGGAPITIGYGHTGPEVKLGQVITQAQAEQLLRDDVEKLSTRLKACLPIHISPNSNAYCALLSFTYNIGLGAFKSSTMYGLIQKSAPKEEIALEFIKWSRAGGRHLPGLIKRRAKETILFLT